VRDQCRAGAAAGSECGVTAVDPATWRLVTLKLPNPDGSGDIIDIRCLRSPEWLTETGAEPGGWILFGLPEIGVVGPAYVVTVEPCPPVEAGPGRVVLATVTHCNSFVLRPWGAGLDEPPEPTAEHPLYSEDRQAWVPAGELRVGELLRTAAGPAAHAGTVRRGTKGRPQGDSNPYQNLTSNTRNRLKTLGLREATARAKSAIVVRIALRRTAKPCADALRPTPIYA